MGSLSIRTFLLFLLGITCTFTQWTQRGISKRSERPNPAVNHNEDDYEWTTWFNVDHPGGKGDYEKLNVIGFYYRTRVCEVPRALEARTTEWIPARSTGERVHADPAVGFWCVNAEQPVGRNCSNYAVRFLCPKHNKSDVEPTWGPWSDWSPCPAPCDQVATQHRSRSCKSISKQCNGQAVEGRTCEGPSCPSCDLHCVMGSVNAECDGCTCKDHTVLGSVRSAGGLPAPGAAILRTDSSPRLLTVTDHNGHFHILGICPDGNTTLMVKLQNHTPRKVIVPHSTEPTSVLHLKLERAKKTLCGEKPREQGQKRRSNRCFLL